VRELTRQRSGNDVINGLRSLALHPEGAEWRCSPQHYLITQDRPEGGREALFMCKQGEPLANGRLVRLSEPAETIRARKERYRTPYGMSSHLVEMEVGVDPAELEVAEEITHELEVRTADPFRPLRNERGFPVSRLEHTVLLHQYSVTLPGSYRQLFRENGTLSMYVCITADVQDIVLTAIRPRGPSRIPDIEWMTLPEILGTYGPDAVDVFRTSVHVTTAVQQGMLPCSATVTA
jgi:hypothetical protein